MFLGVEEEPRLTGVTLPYSHILKDLSGGPIFCLL